MKNKLLFTSVIIALGLAPFSVQATIMTFNARTLFLAATGATSATGPLPNLGLLPGGSMASLTVGAVTLSIAPPSTELYIGGLDWAALLPGNDIGISGVENLNAAFASPVFSAGFDFLEPTTGGFGLGTCYVPVCADSTFTVTLKNSGVTVNAFNFNAPDDVAAFIGVWSDTPFNRMEIRETVGTNDDEYFGQFYSGSLPLQAPAIPEPTTMVLMLAGAGVLAGLRWKGRDNFTPIAA